jgi:hypothetical protein
LEETERMIRSLDREADDLRGLARLQALVAHGQSTYGKSWSACKSCVMLSLMVMELSLQSISSNESMRRTLLI